MTISGISGGSDGTEKVMYIHDVVVSPAQFDGSPLKANRDMIVTSTNRNTVSRQMLLIIHGARLDRR